MSPIWGVETIADLISIHFHLNKISSWYHLQMLLLSKQYAINFLLDNYHSKNNSPHHMATSQLIAK